MWEQLRKFDLNHCDLPTMMWNVAAGLRVVTLNIDSKYNKGIPYYCYIITIVTATCYFYVFLISMAWFVFIRCPQTGDVISAMVVLSLGIASEIGTLKLSYMFVFVDKIKNIADAYLECDAQVERGSRFHTNLLKTLRIVKRRAIVFWLVINCNGILYILQPLVKHGRNLPENHFLIYGLEPKFETPNYEISYALMAASVFFVCYVPACTTAYPIVIAGYTESQMLALANEMRCIWPDAIRSAKTETGIEDIEEYNPSNKKVINKYVQKHLKEAIVRHSVAINLFHKLEEVYRGAIVMEFIFLVLGLIVELLGKLENTYMQVPFTFLQVAVDCYLGQRVMDSSIVFEQAVYDCQWEKFDKTNMKLVLLMLQSSQKTMTLSAGGLATLTFTSLMSITRGIYSTYTAIRSTIK